VEYYVRIGAWMDAAEAARAAKDPNLLLSVKNKCTNREALMKIDQMLQQFSAK